MVKIKDKRTKRFYMGIDEAFHPENLDLTGATLVEVATDYYAIEVPTNSASFTMHYEYFDDDAGYTIFYRGLSGKLESDDTWSKQSTESQDIAFNTDGLWEFFIGENAPE